MTIMTVVVDDVTSVESNPITETQEVLDQVTLTALAEETQEPVENEYTPPEKYAGKSMQEVIEMHQNAEKAIGKQGQTVGDQRQLIDNLLEAQKATQTTAPTEEPNSFEDQFYNDPALAVNSAIENHPELIKAREEREINEQQHQLGVLEKAYPDWETRVADSDFQKWLGSSEIRQEMFRKADSDYRPDYAIELFDMYDKVNMIDKTKEVNEQEASKREVALKKTSSETRSSGDSVGGKKIYRRADLINLQVTDPRRYEALADDIQSAYAEGRVR